MFAMQRAALLRVDEWAFVMNAEKLGAQAARLQFVGIEAVSIFRRQVWR